MSRERKRRLTSQTLSYCSRRRGLHLPLYLCDLAELFLRAGVDNGKGLARAARHELVVNEMEVVKCLLVELFSVELGSSEVRKS
jgi:hypothetical protein